MNERERTSEPQNTYMLRHLASHLAAAERWDELHALVGEGEVECQKWAEAQHGLDGSYASYLADLQLTWQLADEEGSAQQPCAVGRQVRYALIESSLRSLAACVPPELLVALVENQVVGWTPEAALEYARQIPDEERRCHALKYLAPTLPPNLLVEELADIRRFRAPANQMQVLNAFVPHLPSDLLDYALLAARDISDELCRSLAFRTLILHSPPGVLLDVLAEVANMTNETARSEILWGSRLPAGLLTEALSMTQGNKGTEARARIENSLRPFTPTQPERHIMAQTWRELESGNSNHRLATEWTLPQDLPPELRQQACIDALAAVRKISDVKARSQVFGQLAPHLSEPILTEVFGETCRMSDDPARITVLIDLMPYLPLELRQQARAIVVEALPMAREITDGYVRGEFLSRLAPFLSTESLAEALTMIRELRDPGFLMSDRTAGLIHLAPHLSRELLPEALAIARGIAGEYDRAKVLRSLASQLPEQLLAEAVKITLEIQQVEACALALSGLAPHLSPQLFENALMIILQARETEDSEQDCSVMVSVPQPADLLKHLLSEMSTDTMTDSDRRIIVLRGLAARLSQESLGELLTATWHLHGECHRVDVLERLAPYLQSELLSTTFTMTRGIEDESLRARTVIALAPHLPVEMLSSALAIGLGTKDAYERVAILCELVPRLPSDLTPTALVEVLNSIQDFDNGFYCAEAVGKIAGYLPRVLMSRALEVAQGIEQREARVEALVKLATYLPTEERWDVLRTAVKAAREIGYPLFVGHESVLKSRGSVLGAIAKLVAACIQGERRAAWSLWVECLHELAGQYRQRLMADLNAFIPPIVEFGGTEGAEEMGRAIIDVGRWWP